MDGTVGLISFKKKFEGNKTVLGGVNEASLANLGNTQKSSIGNLVVRVNDNE